MDYYSALNYETYYLNSNYLYHGLVDLLIDDVNFNEPEGKLLANSFWQRQNLDFKCFKKDENDNSDLDNYF